MSVKWKIVSAVLSNLFNLFKSSQTKEEFELSPGFGKSVITVLSPKNTFIWHHNIKTRHSLCLCFHSCCWIRKTTTIITTNRSSISTPTWECRSVKKDTLDKFLSPFFSYVISDKYFNKASSLTVSSNNSSLTSFVVIFLNSLFRDS